MGNKWFDDTFLPSLLNRFGTNNRHWLSAKQTAVCAQHMTMHSTQYAADHVGDMTFTHNWYTYEWQGRKVYLDYSKKNGCGCIEFGFNAEEQEQHRREVEREEAEREQARIAFIKSRPDKLARKLTYFDDQLKRMQEYLEAEQAEPDELSPEYIEYYRSEIARLNAEKAKYI